MVSLHSKSLLVLGQATGNMDSLDSPWPEFRGSHHLPPYSILYVRPRDLHPNGFLSQDSLPRRSPKIVPVWTPGTLGAHNSWLRPPIMMRSKAKLYLSSRAFQRCVALHLHTPETGRFSTFSGWESNC